VPFGEPPRSAARTGVEAARPKDIAKDIATEIAADIAGPIAATVAL